MPATGTCTHQPKPDGTACNDGNLCTQTDACQTGICVGSNQKSCPEGNQCQENGQCDPGTGNCLFPGRADGTACDDGDSTTSSDGCHAGVCIGIPALPTPAPTNLATSLAFVYQGPGASQTGVAAGTIQTYRAAGIRGNVYTRDGSPLLGATVAIAGHAEFGRTLSRTDGGYDLVVNGGQTLTVTLSKAGYLPVDRPVDVPWQGFGQAEDAIMLPVDPQTTTINLTQQAQQVAVGSVSTDDNGTRQAVLVVPAGTQAMMDLPDGTTVALDTFNVHITEFTVGDAGPSAMPAPLPLNTQYTYAVDYSTDEGLAAGAKSVRFTQPIYHYSENFLGFPVGTGIPAGYYDRSLHAWVPSQNGAVVEVLSVENGLAQLDVDGSGNPAASDWRQAMGITDNELAFVAQRYQPGQTLWRVPVPHFTALDYNYMGAPPDDATGPMCSVGNDQPTDTATPICGSIIEAQNQVVGERVPVAGTPFTLNYRSNRVEGFEAANALQLSLSGASVPSSLLSIKLDVAVADRKYLLDFPPSANFGYQFLWDGKDSLGRPLNGSQRARVSVGYEYPLEYYQPGDALYHTARDFGNLPQISTKTGVLGRQHLVAWQDLSSSQTVLGTYLAKSAGLGAWTLDVNHVRDTQRTLWRGNGEREVSRVNDSGSGAIVPAFYSSTLRIAGGADGSLYVAGTPDGLAVPSGGLAAATIWKVDRTSLNHTTFFTLGQVPGVENGPYYYWTGPWNRRQVKALTTGPDDSLYLSADVWQNLTNARYIDHVSRTGSFLESWKVVDESGSGNVLSIAVGPDGTVYYLVGGGCFSLMKLSASGQISRVAGGNCSSSNASGDGGMAANAIFKTVNGAVDLAVGPDGSLYIANQSECRVRRIGTDGIIDTVAGTICPATGDHSGDGGPATAAKINPTSIMVGPDGVLYIGDADYWEVSCRTGDMDARTGEP